MQIWICNGLIRFSLLIELKSIFGIPDCGHGPENPSSKMGFNQDFINEIMENPTNNQE